MSNIELDAETYADKFTKPESDHSVIEPDEDWLYDGSRNPRTQADILRSYKP